MKPGSLLLTLGSLVLWALPLLLGAPLKSRCLLKCQRDEDCPFGHTCASFRGRQLCRPVAAFADSGVPGTPSPTHGSHTGMPQSSGAHPKGETASEPPLPDASPGDTQLTQSHPVPTGSKPTSHSGEGAHKETAPHEKPESAGKPAPDKKPEPAKEAKEDGGDDSFTEGVEEDVEEGGEEEDGEPGGDSDEGDSDSFDKELDYGLDRSPFNAYEYHDAWSDDGSNDPKAWLDGGPAEDATGLGN